jgi:hypothetical protein
VLEKAKNRKAKKEILHEKRKHANGGGRGRGAPGAVTSIKNKCWLDSV